MDHPDNRPSTPNPGAAYDASFSLFPFLIYKEHVQHGL